MRKIIAAVICLVLLLLCLSACFNTRGPIPYGKWESVEPNIIMDLNPYEYDSPGRFYGTYYEEDEVIDIYISISSFSKEFAVKKFSDIIYLDQPDSYKLALFDGSYRIKGDKLYYKLKPYWQEKSGVTHTIVFTKIEEYEAPDPSEDPN